MSKGGSRVQSNMAINTSLSVSEEQNSEGSSWNKQKFIQMKSNDKCQENILSLEFFQFFDLTSWNEFSSSILFSLLKWRTFLLIGKLYFIKDEDSALGLVILFEKEKKKAFGGYIPLTNSRICISNVKDWTVSLYTKLKKNGENSNTNVILSSAWKLAIILCSLLRGICKDGKRFEKH